MHDKGDAGTKRDARRVDLDFLAPEFNRIDDLQDCSGNFRSFQTLEGVVTADMRHRAERDRAAAPGFPEATTSRAARQALADPPETWDDIALPQLTALPGGRGILFDVDHGADVRFEMLLCALALGTDPVVVTCSQDTPPAIREAARWQTVLAAAFLHGLGMPEERIRFFGAPAEGPDGRTGAPAPEGDGEQAPATAQPTAHAPAPDAGRRRLARRAAQELYDRSGASQPAIPLPEGAPFGAVAVAGAQCTLCMACVAACPSGALSAPGEVPRLEFRESRCDQCGLCRGRCPEAAVRLVPRLLCDPAAVEAPAVLHEVEAAACLVCGTPFAAPAMIRRVRERLRGHWMYADERQMRRLDLCATCRARDTLASGDPRRWAR